MNKQKLMVPLCLASAGMLAVTGLLGVQTTGRQKITETVEYVMEELSFIFYITMMSVYWIF